MSRRHLPSPTLLKAVAMVSIAVAACSGTSARTVPPGGADLTLYVRNASDPEAQILIEFGPDGGSQKGIGFGKTIGISCNTMPAGSRVVLVDGLPSATAAAAANLVIFEATGAEGHPVRWLDVDATGQGTVGAGVPGWWSGPPSC